MDCLFFRDSLGRLSNMVDNHFSAQGMVMVMMTLMLTMGNGIESWACRLHHQGACNYDPDATSNDGSCDFVSCLAFGCTNATACNFDPAANYSDGSCEYVSCAGCITKPRAISTPMPLAATCTDMRLVTDVRTTPPPTTTQRPRLTTAHVKSPVAPLLERATTIPVQTSTTTHVIFSLVCPADV